MEYLGLRINTDPGVYEPAEDSMLAARVVGEEIDEMGSGLSVLDMGCGSGIVGLSAAVSDKVYSVVFADVSGAAVALCRQNVDSNSDKLKARCTVVKSDLFEEIGSGSIFDIIAFNAPYLADGAEDDLSNAWYGGEGGVEVSVEFLKQAYTHLSEAGVIVLLASSMSDIETLYDAISQQGFMVARDSQVHINFEDMLALVIKKQAVIGS